MTSKSRIILPILVLLGSAACALLLVRFKRETEPQPILQIPPLVRILAASPTNHQFIVNSQGTVLPQSDIQLVTEVPGRVIQISPSLAVGGFFEAGDDLITVDPRDYELARIRAAAQVRQAELRATQEEAEAQVALREWKELGEDRGEPSDLLLRKPQMAEAAAALAAAQAALSQAELNLQRTRIQAPFKGRVWEKRVDIGQYVTPGASLGRIYSVDIAEIRLPVSLPDLAYLGLPLDHRPDAGHPLPQVQLHANVARQNQTWTGQIVRIEGEIDPATRMVTLVAQVPDPYDQAHAHPGAAPLAVGLFVEAEITGRSVSSTFELPRTALRGRNQVLIVDDENKLRFRDVNVLRAGRETVIIDQGLQAGERVSISILDNPQPGMQVRTEDRPPAPTPSHPNPNGTEPAISQ